MATQRPLPFQRRRAKLAASVSILLLLISGLFATLNASTYQAESNYKSKEYQDALTQYEEAAKANKDTLLEEQLEFNAGDAAYRAGNFTEAEDAFNKALHTKDLPLQEKTYYNLGNTEFRRGQDLLKSSEDTTRTKELWENSLKSYQSTLDLNPKNEAAKNNMAVVKAMLEELKKKHPSDGSGKGNDKGQKSKPGDQNGSSSDQNQDQSGKPSQPQQGSQDSGGNPGDKSGNSGQGNQAGSTPDDKGSDPSKPGDQPGQQEQPQPQPGEGGSTTARNAQQAQQMGTSNGRAEDAEDPGSKTKEEAVYLLDSLKGEEHHISSRQMNDGTTPPPTASGKDW